MYDGDLAPTEIVEICLVNGRGGAMRGLLLYIMLDTMFSKKIK